MSAREKNYIIDMRIIVRGCVFALLALLSFSIAHAKPLRRSSKRLRKIQKIIKAYKKDNVDFSDPTTIETIYQEVSDKYTLEPAEDAIQNDQGNLPEKVMEIVKKKFPKSAKQIEKEAGADADKLFELAKIGDWIKVRYNKGDVEHEHEGYFNEYGGNSIRINFKNIAIFDLLPKYRVKFDKIFAEREKMKYINNIKSEYFNRKTSFSCELYKKLKNKNIQTNEDNGYIYAWKKWRSPKDVVDMIIRGSKHKRSSKSKDSDDDKKTTKPVKLADNEKPDKQDEKTEAPDEPEASKDSPKNEYEKLRKISLAKKLEIANKAAGIDADCGYKLALWDMPREDIDILFRGALDDKANPAKLIYDDGPVKEVELYFTYGVFYKVVLKFRTIHSEAVEMVMRRIRNRYGLTDKEKETLKAEEGKTEEEINEAEKAEEAAEQPAEEVLPTSQTYYWTGHFTHGTLIIHGAVNKDGGYDYTELTLIKEAPSIKEKAESEAEFKRKAAEKAKRKKMKEKVKDWKLEW